MVHAQEKLYVELKKILGRQPGPEVSEQLALYQDNLKHKVFVNQSDVRMSKYCPFTNLHVPVLFGQSTGKYVGWDHFSSGELNKQL